MVSRSCECASQAERDTELNAFGGGQFRGPLDALVGVINSAEGLRDDDRGPGGAGRRSRSGQSRALAGSLAAGGVGRACRVADLRGR